MPRSRKTEIVISRPATARSLVISPRTTIVQQSQPRSRRARRRRRQTSRGAGSMDRLTAAYINTLKDPFEFPGIRVGFGCLSISNLYTAYARQMFTVNADGSFGLFMLPFLGGPVSSGVRPIFINTAGIGSTTWGGYAFTDTDAIFSVTTSARVVSGGIKVMPLVPATGSGALYAGSFPMATKDQLVASSVLALTNSPLLNMGYGATGGSAMVLPVDPFSYSFSGATAGWTAGGAQLLSSVPVILGTGFQPGTVVIMEAILNLEGLPLMNPAATVMNTPDQRVDSVPTLADSHVSLERLWSTIKPFIPESSSINAGTTMLRSVASTAARLARARQTYLQAFSNDRSGVNPLSRLSILD